MFFNRENIILRCEADPQESRYQKYVPVEGGGTYVYHLAQIIAIPQDQSDTDTVFEFVWFHQDEKDPMKYKLEPKGKL